MHDARGACSQADALFSLASFASLLKRQPRLASLDEDAKSGDFKLMSRVCLSDALTGNTALWRYMALDKFIDLLSTSHLFFSPLASYAKTDPFEGFLPAVCLKADAEISKGLSAETPAIIEILRKLCADPGQAAARSAFEKFDAAFEDLKTGRKRFFPAIMQSIAVSCWHQNSCESEAMWRLYAENGKAVAIETTADALRSAIESRASEHRIHIHPVKYVDFFDDMLLPQDCVVGGHRAPLLKRRSYEHEHEVRAFICRPTPENPREMLNLDYWRPTAVKLPVDVALLVKRVYVSPYQSEPFESSVRTICEVFGLGTEIIETSRLLSGQEDLVNMLAF